jgi:hypothetical protein
MSSFYNADIVGAVVGNTAAEVSAPAIINGYYFTAFKPAFNLTDAGRKQAAILFS